MSDFTILNICVACGGDNLKSYLDLGEQPLANSFHDGSKQLEVYPLGLNLCNDCYHSQNLGYVNPEILYTDYPYVSGTTKTLKDYFSAFADRMMVEYGRGPLRVLEIASNDGSLLHEMKRRGHIVVGVEPCEHLVKLSRSRQLPTVHGYWGFGVLSPGAQLRASRWMRRLWWPASSPPPSCVTPGSGSRRAVAGRSPGAT